MALQSRVNQEPQADVRQAGQRPCTSGQGQLNWSMTVARVTGSPVTMRHIHSDKAGLSPSLEVKTLDQHQVLDEQ